MDNPIQALMGLLQQRQQQPQQAAYQGHATANPVLTASNPPNADMLRMYQKSYDGMFPPGLLENKAAIMKAIDDLSLRTSRLSPGASYSANGGYQIEKLKYALADIYGINNYTPQGFQAPPPRD